MHHLSKRLNALETKLSPQGPVLCFLAMNDDLSSPMTGQEIENKIAAMRRAGTPVNTRIEPLTLLSGS